jgi:phosphate-selective porin
MAAVAALLIAAGPRASFAQAASPSAAQKSDATSKPDGKPEVAPSDKGKSAKLRTALKQKVKDCAAKWPEAKKSKGLSGRVAYQQFLAACVKS